MVMENLWTRRSNSSKLSLSTSGPTNGTPPNNEPAARAAILGRRQDSSSYNRSSLGAMSPNAVTSPTTAATSAFGLGSGAFASFGSVKQSKTPGTGGSLDFSNVIGGGTSRTPTSEKQLHLGSRPSKPSVSDIKSSIPPVKRPLKHNWVFWFRPPQSKSNGYTEYDKTIHPMATIASAEDFFTVYKHLKRPSSLPLVSDYHMFKEGIRPIWEDEDNKKGGKWIVRLKKGVADRYWEDLILAMVGDQFAEASDEVCGAVLSVRNGEDILSIWARNDGGRVLRIRETMKRILAFPPDTRLEWKSHDSSIMQRTALDDARREKSNNNLAHGQHAARSAGREEHGSPAVEKK